MIRFNNCTRCQAELKPPSELRNLQRRRTDFPIRENALLIEVHGGYAMYYDDSPVMAILCEDCAGWFLTENQWLADWISAAHTIVPPAPDMELLGNLTGERD